MERNKRKIITGNVVSDKGDKKITSLSKHKKATHYTVKEKILKEI